MYKIIIADVDGTLADKYTQEISPAVVNSIKKWIDTGHYFSLATGRQYLNVDKMCKTLHINAPIILRGGSEICDPQTGAFLQQAYIEKNITAQIIPLLKESNIPFSVETGSLFYSSTQKPLIEIPGVTNKNIREFEYSAVPKIVLWTDTVEENYVENFLAEKITPQFSSVHIIKSYTSTRKTWDITSQRATKYLAVLELSKLLNTDLSVMIGVGDGYNDYPLLTACGYKVAMENAPKELKDIADKIIPAYTEDGVSVLIDELLQNNS